MKKIYLLLLSVLVGMSLSATAADDNLDNYFGIGIVKSNWDQSLADGGDVYNFEYDNVNFKGFIGTKIDDNFALEAQYVNFADDDIEVNGIAVPVSVGGNSFGVAGLYHVDGFFLKLGVHSWDLTASAAGIPDFNDDGSDLFYGVGFDLNFAGTEFADKLLMRIEYETLVVDDESVNNLGIGFVSYF